MNSLFRNVASRLPSFAAKPLGEAYRRRKQARLARFVTRNVGLRVQSGIFKGLNYVPESFGSEFFPKLIGSYECELYSDFEVLLKRNYQTVINIGCGEGYYAVGLAMRLPSARVYAFDVDEAARQLCQKMARLNAVEDRIHIGELCKHSDLASLIDEKTLIVCDCEGCELELLDPQIVPQLKQADVVVELHDFVNREITRIVTSRFAVTHRVELRYSQERNPSQYAVLSRLSRDEAMMILSERRPEQMTWAVMTVLNKSTV